MRKKLTFLLIAILTSLGAMASPPQQDEGNVAKWNNTEYATLQEAFDAAEAAANPEYIVIDLLADASLDITAWSGEANSLSVGTATTKSITINGNNHKLDFVLKDSDWDNFATMNDAQTKLILNDLIITNSGYNTGHWKRRGVFFHCAVELNNVTAQCGIGFKNDGTINNVTINTGTDVYPIWVQADGPTEINIDGLTVNGERGIKISDEDAAQEKVILNIKNSSFTTSKKGAILVATNYGAEINDLGGNDLSKVAADSQNLVWIDEAPAYSGSINDIIVTGATKVLEGAVAKIGDTFYKTLATAEAAASAGDKIEIIQPGTYKLPNISKNVTIEGIVDGVVIDATGAKNTGIVSIRYGATFKNLTFNFGSVDYHGFYEAGTINMEGCTLNGKLFSYGNMNFTNCTFNQTNSDYHMWCYDGDLTYSNCIFTNEATGKFLNVYNEGNGDHKVTVTGCKFVNEGSVNKAALNVKATCGSTLLTYDVYITESTTEGAFPAASISSKLVVLNKLVQVDDRTATGVDKIRVWNDGVQIYPLKPVAKIGEVGYPTLQSAVDAAYTMTGDVTIQLVDDITEYAIVLQKAGLNLTIDGKDGETNHTIKGQIIIDGAGNLDNTETLVISNLNFEGNKDDFSGNSDAFILIPSPKDSGKPWHYTNTTNKDHYNYAHNITVSNCSFVSTSENSKGYDVVGVKVPSQGARNIVIDQCSGDNLHSLAQLAATEGGAITNCEVKNGESLVNVNGGSGTFTVSGNTLAAAEGSDGYGVRENGESSATINLSDNNFKAANAIVFGKGDSKTAGTINVTSGTYVGGITKTTAATGRIVISGGHFSAPIYEDAYSAFIAEGLTGINGLYADETPQAPNGIGEAVAQVDDVKFGTFSAAVTAAAGTKVIVLLKDIAATYAMTAGETLKVQKEGKAFNNPTAPADFTLKTLIDGAVTIYSVKANENLANISEGYYHIKNLGNNSYVNVKGRRTATVDATANDASTAAGTIIKVKATNGQVEVLRSQAIDIPHYADRAMSYVHDFAKLLVEKLNASGSGEILGTTGFDALMKKFDDNFDHHLYVEQVQDGYRIFGRTPSMKPVVEFYQENKAKVDAKLPMLEQKINDAIAKVVDKVGKGSSLIGSFELHTIWQRMNNSALTEPNDDATKLAFLQEVLSSEINVWNFAYESATFYMEKVEGSQYFEQIPADIRNYWNLAKQVHPDFKYYIVQKDGKMDFISEGNTDIINNNLRTVWALEQVTEFKVNIPTTNSKLAGKDKKEYYTTIYTDFGYQLPEGVTALKVTEIKEVKELGLAVTEEIGRKVAPQTPVLIKSETAGDITLKIDDNCGTAVTDNLLHGADWLINEYEINTTALEGLFALVDGKISAETIKKYEHLLRRNSGTVNNKYFFPISVKKDLAPAYKEKNNDQEMEDTPIRILGKKGKFLAFNDSWDDLPSNAVFLFNEDYKPVFLNLIGDVDRDGDIDLDDVNATIDIVLDRDVTAKDYDFEAADVHETFEKIDLDDVNTLIDLVLNRITLKSLIEKILQP